jgi:hypothetical protein
MPEDQEDNLTARGLKTELIAPIGSAVGAILAGVLQESLSKQSLAILLICSLVLMTVGFCSYTVAIHRLRAKIAMLEKEKRSLSRPPVVALPKSYSEEQHAMLIQLAKSSTRSRNITHQGTLAVLESLESAGLIDRRHNEFDAPWWELINISSLPGFPWVRDHSRNGIGLLFVHLGIDAVHYIAFLGLAHPVAFVGVRVHFADPFFHFGRDTLTCSAATSRTSVLQHGRPEADPWREKLPTFSATLRRRLTSSGDNLMDS